MSKSKRYILFIIMVVTISGIISIIYVNQKRNLEQEEIHRRIKLRNIYEEVKHYSDPLPSLYEIFLNSSFSIDDFIIFVPGRYEYYVKDFQNNSNPETFNKISQYRIQQDKMRGWYIEELNSGTTHKFFRIWKDGEIEEKK